ncbi:cell division protein ZipA [Pseudomaricurvus sp. HS19]|uniref:cell division protein ZipA n=1 Tax=Pseudomaricurvus sp. HS19 TaxID=2692626 RepID=UPI001370964F|nr:cell division protein ZipA [Pseudomaricurvus sp. HS19]MYM62105.1 cell division protein ZipA [Pseudomaricurvus sp. HS19]
MREWLTVIIVLLIVAVLLDGWRRMRHTRRHSLKMSRNVKRMDDRPEPDGFGSELPNGGARVVRQRDASDARQFSEDLKENFVKSRVTLGKSRIPEQVSLNLDEEVPMLMDPVDQAIAEAELREQEEFEPALGNVDSLDDELGSPRVVREAARPEEYPEPEEPTAESDAEEVIIINVMSVGDERFQGQDLLEVVLRSGMRFGDMQIFHRHEHEDGEGSLLFSMVNMVVPGTFDLAAMDEFETPGVSLFMTLPMQSSSMDAFNLMVDTAKAIASNLGGELKDEQRSVMTMQTIEHCRQRIRDFERKQLSRG